LSNVAVGVGLAGAGRRGAAVHAPAIAACDQARFAGVWSRRQDAAQAVADRYHVPAYTDYDEFLTNCDAVAFAVPPAAQPDLAAPAARAGKALLLEKPIAADLAGAEELTRIVDRAGVVSVVALTWRFAAAVRRFLDVNVPATRAAGGNGRLLTPAPGPAVAANSERRARSLLRGGGADLLDLLDAALGNVAAVQAHGSVAGWIGVLLEHQGGRVSEAALYAGVPEAASRAEVEVFGPGGSARIDLAASVPASAVDAMVGDFVKAVQAGAPHELGIHHGLHLQNVIEEAESYLLQSD
jgi:predicted dehydrogenase